MSVAKSGGILQPVESTDPVEHSSRWGRGSRLFGDQQLRWLEIFLDEAFVIPGTGIRFGVDGIIGLIPGLGDLLAGILSLVIPLAAWIRGVPYITLVRMLVNVAIGLLIGTIPIAGDVFDIFWKANRRNYRLLERSIAQPRRHTWRDWAFLMMLAMAVAAVFSAPLSLVLWAISLMAGGHVLR